MSPQLQYLFVSAVLTPSGTGKVLLFCSWILTFLVLKFSEFSDSSKFKFPLPTTIFCYHIPKAKFNSNEKKNNEFFSLWQVKLVNLQQQLFYTVRKAQKVPCWDFFPSHFKRKLIETNEHILNSNQNILILFCVVLGFGCVLFDSSCEHVFVIFRSLGLISL